LRVITQAGDGGQCSGSSVGLNMSISHTTTDLNAAAAAGRAEGSAWPPPHARGSCRARSAQGSAPSREKICSAAANCSRAFATAFARRSRSPW
jgi:hypothetical protein